MSPRTDCQYAVAPSRRAGQSPWPWPLLFLSGHVRVTTRQDSCTSQHEPKPSILSTQPYLSIIFLCEDVLDSFLNANPCFMVGLQEVSRGLGALLSKRRLKLFLFVPNPTTCLPSVPHSHLCRASPGRRLPRARHLSHGLRGASSNSSSEDTRPPLGCPRRLLRRACSMCSRASRRSSLRRCVFRRVRCLDEYGGLTGVPKWDVCERS